MPGLMELGPMASDIDVMGQKLTLYPISVGQLIELFSKFPILIKLLEGKPLEDAVSIIGPIAVANVIACATGEGDNPAAVAVAMKLSAGKVAEAVEKIMEITFEDGTGPFVERIGKNSRDTTNLLSMVSAQESSVPWSASLVGEEDQRPMRLKPRLVNSVSG